MSDRVPFRVQPMLATLVREPFDRPGWVYEEKYDGYRILAYKEGDRVTLLSRNAKDRTATFSVVAQAVASLDARTLVLDGEVVVFDRHNVSRFQLLQNLNSPPKYAVFDCLYRDGRDLRSEPLSVRRATLEESHREVGWKKRHHFSVGPLGGQWPQGVRSRQAQRLRGCSGERRIRSLHPGTLRKMAQVQGASGGRVRDRGLHRAGRFPPTFRRAAVGSVRRAASSITSARSGPDLIAGSAGQSLPEVSAARSRQAHRRSIRRARGM